MDINNHLNGVQHIGIPTNDLEKTIAFYHSLGFTTAYRTVNEKADEPVAFLQSGNLMIEAYENRNAVQKTGAIDHIALDVKDIDSLFEKIHAAGFRLLDTSVQSLPFWEHGVRFFTIIGPNAEKIEFCERG